MRVGDPYNASLFHMLDELRNPIDRKNFWALLATIDAACDRMRAARTEEPAIQAKFLCEEFGKIVEAKRLYDAAVRGAAMSVIDFDRAVADRQAKEQAAIAARLPQGKTVEEALLRAVRCRQELWQSRRDLDEDERIDALLDFCTRLMGGDVTAGQFLASAAIWA